MNDPAFQEEMIMQYQHILVAIDLTEECVAVLERAAGLARTHGARLCLVHIVEPMAMAFGGAVPMDLSMLQQQQFDQARERLDTFTGRYAEILPADQRHLAYGQPRQAIHRLAIELGCDLIVVGSHGRRGLAVLPGCAANERLHGAPRDVQAARLKKEKEKEEGKEE